MRQSRGTPGAIKSMRCILLPLQILATVWPTHSIVDTCDVCGRHPLVPSHGRSEHVVGGADAQPGAWPWVVSLQLPTITGHKHSCGGSLVSGRWVLTAAHCFLNKRDLPHWRAVIGAWKLSSLGSEVHVRYIKRIVIHEDYQRSTETSDIALMELDQPVKCSYYIQPACLPDMTVSLSPLNHCYISGWGILGKAATRDVTDVMHEVRVNRFSVAQCNSSTWYNGAIERNTLCAGYEEGGADICQGDSGGPLMCQEDGTQPFWIIGITSWGQGCGKVHKPGVYTDTQHFYPWIEQLAGPMPQPPPTPMPMPTLKVSLQSESTPHPSSAPKSPSSTPGTTQAPTVSSTPLQTTSRKKQLIYFWPPSTVTPLLWPKTQPLSPSTSGVPSTKPTAQPHDASPNTVQIEIHLHSAQEPTSPPAKPSFSSPHATSQVLSPSSHAKVLPESTVQPKTTRLLEIEIISEPMSKSPPQPPTPSKIEGQSLLASIIQSLQTSTQPSPSTSPKTETSSQTTSHILSSSSSSHAELPPASTVPPDTSPLLDIEIISEPTSKSPPQPPTPSKTTIQSTLQTSTQPSPSTSPKTETSSQTTSQTASSSSSSHAELPPASTVPPDTSPLLEIETISEPTSNSPPQSPTPSKTEGTSLLTSISQPTLQTSTQPSPSTSPKTEMSSQATTHVLSSSSHAELLPASTVQPFTSPLLDIEIVSELGSETPHPPTPSKTEGTSPLAPVVQSTLHTSSQHNPETPPKPEIPTEVSSMSKTESQPFPGTIYEAPYQSTSTCPPTSKAPPHSSPQTEPEATTQPVTSQTTPEAPTQPETQTSPQITSELETESGSHVVIVLNGASDAPTHSETLQTEPTLEPETPLLSIDLPPETSPPTPPPLAETTPQPETSRQPNPEAHPNPQSPQAPSQPIAQNEIVPIIEISHTDNTVLKFLRIIQQFSQIIKNLKDAVWIWPDLLNLKLFKQSDLASLEEELERRPEDDLPGESW